MQLAKTLKVINQEKAPSTVFELKDGTIFTEEEDNKTGMHRGNAYFFSYTVTYIEPDGSDRYWPMSESNDEITYTNQSLKTDIVYPDKQEPSFVLFPKTSTNNSITYTYSCKDIDQALNLDSEITYSALNNKGKIEIGNIRIDTSGELKNLILNNLDINKEYEISYKRNLNKAKNKRDSEEVLTTQFFEGIVDCSDVSIGEIKYNQDENPNIIKIIIEGDNINRIAAAKVIFIKEGKEPIKTKLLKPEIFNEEYYLNVDILDLVQNYNFEEFMGSDIGVAIEIYYDNGRIGFQNEEYADYTAYGNLNDKYMTLNENNNFIEDQSIIGNIYRYQFEINNENASLGLQNMNSDEGRTIFLMYSPQGLKQNGHVIVPKQISTSQISYNGTINIQELRIGINVKNINSTLNTATIYAEISEVLNQDISKIVIEIYHSKEKDVVPNWEQAEFVEVDIDNIETAELEDLSPGEFYSIRFKYKESERSGYLYMYDMNTKEVGKIYTFETIATIGARDINIEYNANNYVDKILNISYRINKERSNMYEKLKYTFYKADTNEKVMLTNSNIIVTNEENEYQVIGGSLVVTNSKYPTGDKFEEINERINISPNINVFEVGQDYKLEIVPTLTLTSGDEMIVETITQPFTIDKLKQAAVGLKMTRKQLSADSNVKYIRGSVSINDKDGIIYGSQWGEYNLHIYKYKDNIDDSVEVDFYSDLDSVEGLKGTTLSIKTNAKNFPFYIKPQDVDYEYNYIAELTFKVDKQNKGIEYLTDRTERYKLSAITNEEEVSIGSALFETVDNKLEVRFYDSYNNIEKIDKIDYYIFEISNNFNQSGTFEPEWFMVGNAADGVAYYKVNLPVEVSDGEVYTIKLNFYVNDTLVGQVDTSYINK